MEEITERDTTGNTDIAVPSTQSFDYSELGPTLADSIESLLEFPIPVSWPNRKRAIAITGDPGVSPLFVKLSDFAAAVLGASDRARRGGLLPDGGA
jgi:hypothetical protein